MSPSRSMREAAWNGNGPRNDVTPRKKRTRARGHSSSPAPVFLVSMATFKGQCALLAVVSTLLLCAFDAAQAQPNCGTDWLVTVPCNVLSPACYNMYVNVTNGNMTGVGVYADSPNSLGPFCILHPSTFLPTTFYQCENMQVVSYTCSSYQNCRGIAYINNTIIRCPSATNRTVWPTYSIISGVDASGRDIGDPSIRVMMWCNHTLPYTPDSVPCLNNASSPYYYLLSTGPGTVNSTRTGMGVTFSWLLLLGLACIIQ